ncbi:MAG: bifunctional DNA-binding transcriptional regulator/O6-methylguanine-DNA methyltransferase Ada [Proteobacteria bacterium]|nr:bifunctional DNA-binding transcriptional regulator/O6-methylguanine-DNA methyltransferase Ada [Pseudomonadota bacterium]
MNPPASPARRGRKTDSAVTTDPRWQRIVARDRSADGSLWYSVRTTRVYCRPSCPSRRADPRNVQLHDTLASARATGFRPCRRCNPEGPSAGEVRAALIERACRLLEDSAQEPSLADLARRAQLSPGHFHRLFRQSTGLTPRQYAAARRAARVRQELARGGRVTDSIYAAGFNSSGRFYAQSTPMLGMTPSRYRAGGVNEDIRFAVGESSLGAVLVASSSKGVAAVLLGQDPQALLRELQDRFPRANLIGADAQYERVVSRIVALVEAPGLGVDLPLDVRGTAFQQRVWRALARIPAGSTASYAQIARRIGAPGSVRAVAGACAANNIAVAIPCHRVVRSDGSLSGYAWGVERKRALLARETGAGIAGGKRARRRAATPRPAP